MLTNLFNSAELGISPRPIVALKQVVEQIDFLRNSKHILTLWWKYSLCSAGQTWKWSAGFSNYTNWAPDEPDNSKNCVSISSLSKNMTTQDCSSRFPFLCYRTGQDNLVLEEENNLVLVEENKTWEEALEHCRALSPPTSYDLVSIQAEDYDYVMKKLVEANAEEVGSNSVTHA